jgi:hypothetical protein
MTSPVAFAQLSESVTESATTVAEHLAPWALGCEWQVDPDGERWWADEWDVGDPAVEDAAIIPNRALDLAKVPTGLLLAVATLRLDLGGLSDEGVVGALQAIDRMVSHLQALRARAMVEVAGRADLVEFAHLEVGAALRLSRRASDDAVHLAWAITHRLPRVLALLDTGAIDLPRARALVSGTDHLAEGVARVAVDAVADAAPGLTVGQLIARLATATIEADPDDASLRFARAVEDRRVVAHPSVDGTGTIVASDLPPDRVATAMARIDRLARSLGRDGRSIDQRRADVVLDLLCGDPADTRVDLTITVDLDTLIARADHAAEIPGWGPVVADIARQALERSADGRWRVRVTDPDTHRTLTSVTTRRRPTTTQRRHVTDTHPTCRFPGCRRPSGGSDVDHRQPHHQGGPTHTDNLIPLCRFHHRSKDEGGWSYRPAPDDAVVWTSPLGQTYPVGPRAP